MDDVSAAVRNKAGEFETGVEGGDATSSPSEPSVVDISLMEAEGDDDDERKKKKKKKKSSSDDKSKSSSRSRGSRSSKDNRSGSKGGWDSGSLGSQLNPNKYTDMGYLTKSAATKFQKGVYLLRKAKYQMAREFHIVVRLHC